MLTLLPTRRWSAAALALTTALSGAGVAIAPAAHADTRIAAAGHPYTITLQMSECGVMYLGTTGTCIVSLQTWMNWALGTNLTIDGIYGPATLAAVEEFQASYANAYPDLGIPTDGHFDGTSRWALAQWYERASNDGQQPPCEMNTGMYCDPGAVEPGLDAGIAGTAICQAAGLASGAVAEPVGVAVDVNCETIMN